MVIKKFVRHASLMGLAAILASTQLPSKSNAQDVAMLTKPTPTYSLPQSQQPPASEQVERPIQPNEKIFPNTDVGLSYPPSTTDYTSNLKLDLPTTNPNSFNYIVPNQVNLSLQNIMLVPQWADSFIYMNHNYPRSLVKSQLDTEKDRGVSAVRNGFENAGKMWAEKNLLPQMEEFGRTILESVLPTIKVKPETQIITPEDDPVNGPIGTHTPSPTFKRWGFSYNIFDSNPSGSLLFKTDSTTMLNLRVSPQDTSFIARTELSKDFNTYIGARYSGVTINVKAFSIDSDVNSRFSVFAGFHQNIKTVQKPRYMRTSSFGLDLLYSEDFARHKGIGLAVATYNLSF